MLTDVSIFTNMLTDVSIFTNMLTGVSIFTNMLTDVNIFTNMLIDVRVSCFSFSIDSINNPISIDSGSEDFPDRETP